MPNRGRPNETGKNPQNLGYWLRLPTCIAIREDNLTQLSTVERCLGAIHEAR